MTGGATIKPFPAGTRSYDFGEGESEPAYHRRHCEHSEAIHLTTCEEVDCFVASLLAMTAVKFQIQLSNSERICVRILAARCARALRRWPPSITTRGRREDRVRAAPAVSRAMGYKKTHTSIQVQRRQSGLPCAVGYGLFRALPGDRLVVTVIPEKVVSPGI
jgi:hypothetical protein